MPTPSNNPKIINSISISPTEVIKKNLMLQEKLKNVRRLLKQKRAIIQYLKRQNKQNNTKKINIKDFFNQSKFPSVNSKALLTMQMLHKNRRPWSKAKKKIALSIYYKSPSTYKCMRKNGIVLPGESTVRHWLSSINYSTDFPKAYMAQIKLKTSEMSENEKRCTILLDEVAIMNKLEYNKVLDEIEGYEDLGTLGRTNKIGSYALVIMVIIDFIQIGSFL